MPAIKPHIRNQLVLLANAADNLRDADAGASAHDLPSLNQRFAALLGQHIELIGIVSKLVGGLVRDDNLDVVMIPRLRTGADVDAMEAAMRGDHRKPTLDKES